MKHLTPAPWFEVQGVPCFKSNVRSSSAITEARRPVLLSRDDPQGREARFSHNGETRPKVLPIGELSWLHTERREEGIQARLPDSCNLFSLLKKLVKLAWREASSASRQSASLPSTRTGVSHTNDPKNDEQPLSPPLQPHPDVNLLLNTHLRPVGRAIKTADQPHLARYYRATSYAQCS